MDTETLYLEMCDWLRREPSQAHYERWAAKLQRMATAAIGSSIRVRMRDRGLAAKVVVSGTITAASPARLHKTNKSTTVVWAVKLHTGRTVHLTRI